MILLDSVFDCHNTLLKVFTIIIIRHTPNQPSCLSAIASAAWQKYLSSFVDTMKQGEQRQQGKRGEILAVQLFLPSCTSTIQGCWKPNPY